MVLFVPARLRRARKGAAGCGMPPAIQLAGAAASPPTASLAGAAGSRPWEGRSRALFFRGAATGQRNDSLDIRLPTEYPGVLDVQARGR